MAGLIRSTKVKNGSLGKAAPFPQEKSREIWAGTSRGLRTDLFEKKFNIPRATPQAFGLFNKH